MIYGGPVYSSDGQIRFEIKNGYVTGYTQGYMNDIQILREKVYLTLIVSSITLPVKALIRRYWMLPVLLFFIQKFQVGIYTMLLFTDNNRVYPKWHHKTCVLAGNLLYWYNQINARSWLEKTWEQMAPKIGQVKTEQKHIFERETVQTFGDLDVQSFGVDQHRSL